MKRMLATILALVVVPYLALLVAARFGQRYAIYFPTHDVPAPVDVGLPQAESVTFTTDDGVRLGGWFVPAATTPAQTTVIVFNGNGGHRAYRAPLAAALAARGMATLLFDYRGYGGNPGRPSEEGLARDARAAHAYVASRPDVDRDRIVYFGESLGTGVAVRLALDVRPHRLILRSPFTSIDDVGRHHYPFLPVRWLLREHYASIDRIARVNCPVLMIAGAGDTLIPPSHSERLYAAAAMPKQLVIVHDADHNHYEMLAGKQIIDAVVEFLK